MFRFFEKKDLSIQWPGSNRAKFGISWRAGLVLPKVVLWEQCASLGRVKLFGKCRDLAWEHRFRFRPPPRRLQILIKTRIVRSWFKSSFASCRQIFAHFRHPAPSSKRAGMHFSLICKLLRSQSADHHGEGPFKWPPLKNASHNEGSDLFFKTARSWLQAIVSVFVTELIVYPQEDGRPFVRTFVSRRRILDFRALIWSFCLRGATTSQKFAIIFCLGD